MSSKVLAAEKQKDEPITEDKKAEQQSDEKKSPARKKVKMRKRKKREKAADLSDQLREEQEIAKAKKQKSGDQRQHECLERLIEKKSEREKKPNKQNSSVQTKACSRHGIEGLCSSRKGGSRLNEMFEKAGRYRFLFLL